MGIHPSTRRRFLRSAAASGMAFGGLDFPRLRGLPNVQAADARLNPDVVRFGPDIEPTVRFLEETPRDEIIEQLLARIAKNLTYRELVAGLLLAGVRNIPGADMASHRNVGGELHCVLVINSAHLASLASPGSERWLPILWAVDQFKISQSRPPRGGGPRPPWHMQPVDESPLPPARKARQAFVDALENWDEEAADPAAAALARSAAAREVFELLCRYSARDYRYIGHKAIYVANAWRTLQCIGWQHAEPVLRSLARALAAYFHNEGHPNTTDQLADRSWRQNCELAETIRPNWQDGKSAIAATTEFLAALRSASDMEIGQATVSLLNREIHPQTVWDAVHGSVAELLMTWPGFDSLHAVTTANALRFAYETSHDDRSRRRILLQAASFVPLFRSEGARRRNRPLEPGSLVRIDRLTEEPLQEGSDDRLDEIFAEVAADSPAAAAKTLAYLNHGGDAQALLARARQLIFRKGDDHHDYKYSSAVFEDYLQLSPALRNPFLAAAMFQLRGSSSPDTAFATRLKAVS